MMQANRRVLLVLGAGLGAAPMLGRQALAGPAAAPAGEAAFQKDRTAILGMAGTFKVTFDFRETVAFTPDYTPIAPKVSGGHEVVRVIEDTGRTISLQHLLVADGDGKTFVIKHWRQDWTYEPAKLLVYVAPGKWAWKAVSAHERQGAWSQTVWQTDDSPRYGGVGCWAHDDGVARWMSDATRRPLARRDAVRHPVYDHYWGTNRHALTPAGWVHEQDNAKIGQKDGATVTFVHEVVLNTYARFDDFEVSAADAYWNATKAYWATVRQAWDQMAARTGGIVVAEVAETGSATGERLMGIADDLAEGKTDLAKATAQARTIIAAA